MKRSTGSEDTSFAASPSASRPSSALRPRCKHQHDFLRPSQLKPLNMATVAEAVGVHETTVSRAIAGKYMSTHGVFELKYFFTSGVRTGGDDVSNTAVKNSIAEIIKNEPRKTLFRRSG